MLCQYLLKSENRLPGRSFIRSAGKFIKRYKIDLTAYTFKQFCYTSGIFGTVINSIDEDVFKAHHPSLTKGKFPARFDQFLQRILFIYWHNQIPLFISLCIERYGKVDIEIALTEFFYPRHKPCCRKCNPACPDCRPQRIVQDFYGLCHIIIV